MSGLEHIPGNDALTDRATNERILIPQQGKLMREAIQEDGPDASGTTKKAVSSLSSAGMLDVTARRTLATASRCLSRRARGYISVGDKTGTLICGDSCALTSQKVKRSGFPSTGPAGS